ncbi:MAG: acyl-CoA dehydrogenase N-terminal domain-containing protein, partial [Nevskiales bacterium]
MPQYNPPLRDMQFVLHEMLDVENRLRKLPPHADIDAATIDTVLEEGGKFCAEVLYPLNQVG